MATETSTDPRAPLLSESMGTTRYECPFCGYDSLDEARMTEHLDPRFGRHPERRDPVTGDVLSAPLTADEREELEALRAEVADLRQAAADNQDAAERAQRSAERAKATLAKEREKADEATAGGGQEG